MIIDEKIIGGCIVKFHRSHLELFGIFLHQDFIGKGIGSELLCGVMKLYPENKIWTLETPDYSKHNHKFYRRNGFIETERTSPEARLGHGFIIFRYPGKDIE